MKSHPAWLAAGLFLAVVLACNVSKNTNTSNNSNTTENSNSSSSAAPTPNRPADAEVYVDEADMAKDNDGEAGDTTTSFEPAERKIHCIITLNKAKAGTKIKAVFVAVDVVGAKNRELESLDYTTNSFEKKIDGHLTWSRDWPKGEYRLDIFINGFLDKQVSYTVE